MKTKLTISDLAIAYNQAWVCDGVPESDVELLTGGQMFLGDIITDTNTGNRYVVQSFNYDGTSYSDVAYQLQVTDYNLAALSQKTIRLPTTVSSPAFDTAYQPSLTKDTHVSVNLEFTGVLSLSDEVDVQLSLDGSAWQSEQSIGFNLSSGFDAKFPLSFICPVGCYYKLALSGSGISILSIKELQI